MHPDYDASTWGSDYEAAAVFSFDLDADEIWRAASESDPGFGTDAIKTRGNFGCEVGVPRLLEVFDRYDLSCTFHVPGKVAEDWPETIQMIHDHGHELAHHGYTHIAPNEMSREEEEEEFKRAMDVFDDLIGETPVGYRNPGGGMSEHTIEFIEDAGMIYDSSRKDTDIPYVRRDSDIIEVPNNYLMDDFVYWGYNMSPPFSFQSGITPNGPVFDTWEDEFEGIHKRNRMFMLTGHPQIIGRASRIDALEDLVQSVVQSGDTWVTTTSEIAEHWKKNHA